MSRAQVNFRHEDHKQFLLQSGQNTLLEEVGGVCNIFLVFLDLGCNPICRRRRIFCRQSGQDLSYFQTVAKIAQHSPRNRYPKKVKKKLTSIFATVRVEQRGSKSSKISSKISRFDRLRDIPVNCSEHSNQKFGFLKVP